MEVLHFVVVNKKVFLEMLKVKEKIKVTSKMVEIIYNEIFVLIDFFLVLIGNFIIVVTEIN